MSDTPINPAPNPDEPPHAGAGKYLDQETWEALKRSGYSEEQLYDDQPFGPIIYSYTRKQAIEDGVLVDLTSPGFARILAKCGIKVHTAMTATCFAEVVCRELTEQTLSEALLRLAAILTRFRETVRVLKQETDRVDFIVVGLDGKPVAMYGHIGPGDNGEPVLTFMLEGED